MPTLDGGDESRVVSFNSAAQSFRRCWISLDCGDGEFPLLMEAWVHNGVRRWLPWEDFSRYAETGDPLTVITLPVSV